MRPDLEAGSMGHEYCLHILGVPGHYHRRAQHCLKQNLRLSVIGLVQ